MADVKWIKITTDIFDDEKILLIESMPDKDAIIVIWFKLLCLAGKQNNSGVFTLNDRIAYTDEMLATIFRRPLQTVRMALKVFEQFGMVEVINSVITIPNWNKHQTLDAYEEKKKRDREYQAKRRAEQKMLVDKSSDSKTIPSSDVAKNRPLEEEVDIDIDKDIEVDKEKDNSVSTNVDTPVDSDAEIVVDSWNKMAYRNGLSQVTKISDTRIRNIKARIKEYSREEVITAINSFDVSPLLIGKKTDWKADFDWLIKKANFLKVHEGNYIQKPQNTNPYAWMENINYAE